MPALHPASLPEDIDEHAARRSIRVTLTIIAALLLFGGLAGFLIAWQVGHRSSGVHHSTSAWSLVFILAVIGITIVVMLLLVRRQYQRPRYRRVIQYGWRRRSRVGKDLRRGRELSAEDMPVAKALVELMHSQRIWVRIFYFGMPLAYLVNGFIHNGLSRWFWWGLAAWFLVLTPIVLRQQRQMIQGYERQSTPTVGDHGDTSRGWVG